MNSNLVFCEECRNDVPYFVQETEMVQTLKGADYHFTGKEAKCSYCNAAVYVPEIMDGNLKSLYDVYRRKNGIVSLEVIQMIPRKYSIGKRPLSLLLGWGEQTFSRFYDGYIPSKQYSEVLKLIYQDPGYFSRLLEAGKENLKSKAAYEKSRKAVDSLLGNTESVSSKLDIITRYILDQCGDITPLALQKLLYYVQGFYFAFFHEYLFLADCEAWICGPVYRNVYFKYRDYRLDPLTPKPALNKSLLSSQEKAVLDSIITSLGCYSGKILESFTHLEDPWLDARGDLPLTINSEKIISREYIGKYFESVKCKYNMQTPDDIKLYALDRFNRSWCLLN